MSDSTQSGDGGDEQLWWTLLKVALIVVGAIVVLRFVFNIVWALLPFIVVAALAYLGYKIFLADGSSSTEVEATDPMLLEHDTTDPILDDSDPLEEKFKDLEIEESHRGADL